MNESGSVRDLDVAKLRLIWLDLAYLAAEDTATEPTPRKCQDLASRLFDVLRDAGAVDEEGELVAGSSATDLVDEITAHAAERIKDRDDVATEKAIRNGTLLAGDHPLTPEERQAEADRFAHNARIKKQILALERNLRTPPKARETGYFTEKGVLP